MKEIFITGASGFVGKNLIPFLKSSQFFIREFKRNSRIDLSNVNAVVHLAGKSHDLKNTLNGDEYYKVNFDLTKNLFNEFLKSDARVFIFISSVKAVADTFAGELTEDCTPDPQTHYGKSKLLAEEFILSNELLVGKRVYILRPCMIHGPGNKGNLSLLFKLVSKNIPWPLGAFSNQRSFCSIDNLLFIIKELIEREEIESGVYNVSDDDAISTNTLISILAESQNRRPVIWKTPKLLVRLVARLGSLFMLPINDERLNKLTESLVVSNTKIKSAIGKPLPVNSKDGLLKTFNSF